MKNPGNGHNLEPREDRDIPLSEVKNTLLSLDPSGERWAGVIRHTYDVIYNGRESGRYRWDQLFKTEKTHFGTLFEIYAQREFQFEGGESTDFRISGHQVDAKWSQKKNGWMLPPEVFDEIALVATGDDARSEWSLGLVRVSENARRKGGNRDGKTTLSSSGRSSIDWLWEDAPLAPNVLLKLDREVVDRIFEPRGGTRRLCLLFEETEGLIVHRNTVETVAKQLDAQKRVRGNGGARDFLWPKGFLILSGKDARIAQHLGCTVPKKDEYIAVRVVPSVDSSGAFIEDRWWRLAERTEVASVPAPKLP